MLQMNIFLVFIACFTQVYAYPDPETFCLFESSNTKCCVTAMTRLQRFLDISGVITFSTHKFVFLPTQDWTVFAKQIIQSGQSVTLKGMDPMEVDAIFQANIRTLTPITVLAIKAQVSGPDLLTHDGLDWRFINGEDFGYHQGIVHLGKGSRPILESKKGQLRFEFNIGPNFWESYGVSKDICAEFGKPRGCLVKLGEPYLEVDKMMGYQRLTYQIMVYYAEVNGRSIALGNRRSSRKETKILQLARGIVEELVDRIQDMKTEEHIGLPYRYSSKQEIIHLQDVNSLLYVSRWIQPKDCPHIMVNLYELMRQYLNNPLVTSFYPDGPYSSQEFQSQDALSRILLVDKFIHSDDLSEFKNNYVPQPKESNKMLRVLQERLNTISQKIENEDLNEKNAPQMKDWILNLIKKDFEKLRQRRDLKWLPGETYFTGRENIEYRPSSRNFAPRDRRHDFQMYEDDGPLPLTLLPQYPKYIPQYKPQYTQYIPQNQVNDCEYEDEPPPLPEAECEYEDEPLPLPEVDCEYEDEPRVLPGIEYEYEDEPPPLPEAECEYEDEPLPLPEVDCEYEDGPPLLPGVEYEYEDEPPPLPEVDCEYDEPLLPQYPQYQETVYEYQEESVLPPEEDCEYEYEPLPPPEEDCEYEDEPLPPPEEDCEYEDEPLTLPEDDCEYEYEPLPPLEEDCEYEDEPLPLPEVDCEYEYEPLPPPEEDCEYEDEPLPLPEADCEYEYEPLPLPEAECEYEDEPPPLSEVDCEYTETLLPQYSQYQEIDYEYKETLLPQYPPYQDTDCEYEYEPLPPPEEDCEYEVEPLPLPEDDCEYEYEPLPLPEDECEYEYEPLPLPEDDCEYEYEPLPLPEEDCEYEYEPPPPPEADCEYEYEPLPPPEEDCEYEYEPPPPPEVDCEYEYEPQPLPEDDCEYEYEPLPLPEDDCEYEYEPLPLPEDDCEYEYEPLPLPEDDCEYEYEPLPLPEDDCEI